MLVLGTQRFFLLLLRWQYLIRRVDLLGCIVGNVLQRHGGDLLERIAREECLPQAVSPKKYHSAEVREGREDA
jgi:hypothetical protein